MGSNRRNLPTKSTRQSALHDNSNQLAPQLGHRLLNTLPRKLRTGQRQPAKQDLLHLVRLLLPLHHLRLLHDLRDQGSYVRTGRRVV